MSAKDVIEELEQLAEQMRRGGPVERANLYYTATPLLAKLVTITERDYHGNGYIKEKISSLKWHLAALAELDEGNKHSVEQHYVWVLGDFARLRGKVAFDL